MQIAARNGSIPMLALVNEFGGSIQSTGPNGDGLFHLAAFNGHLETMKWLRRNGILADAVDSSGTNNVISSHVGCIIKLICIIPITIVLLLLRFLWG